VSATTPEPGGLAFKAYEIEELIDVWFFRRLGIVSAWAARAFGLSPNGVSILAGLAGMVGGALLASDRYDWLGVVLIWTYGVLDSADGQLARLTGRATEWGRVLDGVAGYVTHIAAYLAILARMWGGGGSWWTVPLAVLAGVATIVHAQLYDYHRTSYTAIVVKGRAATPVSHIPMGRGLVGLYERMQRALAGLHPVVEADVASRAANGSVTPADRQRYRASFLGLMSGWNLFGDNVRRYAFAVLTLVGRLEWFFAVVLLLTLPLAVVWLLQRRADARFLAYVHARSVGLRNASPAFETVRVTRP
jgi:phosphatidylglycerophosphate synthase